MSTALELVDQYTRENPRDKSPITFGGFNSWLVRRINELEKAIEISESVAHTEMMQARINELEFKYREAEKLAALVLIHLQYPSVTGSALEEIERSARKIAPPVQSGSGTVTLFSPDGIDVVADKAPHEPGTYTIFGGPAETGEPGTARFVRDECACKFPGLSVSGPSICPTCGKPHRLQFTKGE